MSETKMIMFPRELGDDLAELIATRARVCGGGAYEIWEAICEGFGKTAEQHQGEPVALPARKVHHLDPSFLHDGDKGWNACLDEIAKLGQLYTHADPGEVERLRAALKFYADREHYHFESGKWDTVSGEPLNILWCGDEPDFIEDGAVARAVLEDKPS